MINKFAIINILDKVGCIWDKDITAPVSIEEDKIVLYKDSKQQVFNYVNIDEFSSLIALEDNISFVCSFVVENLEAVDENVCILLTAYDWEYQEDYATVLRVSEIEK